MTEQEKKLFETFASKVFKLDAEAMSGLYNDDGELTSIDVLENANSEKIANLKTEKDNQYKRGLREGATKFEKHIRDAYEVDSEEEGTVLIDLLVDKKVADASEKSKLTDDDIQKHPKFIELKTETDKKVKDAIKARETEFEKEKQEFQRKEVFGKVKDRVVNNYLKALNPILPENTEIANTRLNNFLNEFEGFDYQEKDDDFVVLKDGKVYEDAHGNTVKLSELAKYKADKHFEYKAADDRDNAGNKEGDKKTITFKDKADYNAQIAAEKDQAKQSELAAAWMAQQK